MNQFLQDADDAITSPTGQMICAAAFSAVAIAALVVTIDWKPILVWI